MDKPFTKSIRLYVLILVAFTLLHSDLSGQVLRCADFISFPTTPGPDSREQLIFYGRCMFVYASYKPDRFQLAHQQFQRILQAGRVDSTAYAFGLLYQDKEEGSSDNGIPFLHYLHAFEIFRKSNDSLGMLFARCKYLYAMAGRYYLQQDPNTLYLLKEASVQLRFSAAIRHPAARLFGLLCYATYPYSNKPAGAGYIRSLDSCIQWVKKDSTYFSYWSSLVFIRNFELWTQKKYIECARSNRSFLEEITRLNIWKEDRVTLMHNVANEYLYAGMLDSSSWFAFAALKALKTNPADNISTIGDTYDILARVYQQKKEYNQAFVFLDSSIEYVRKECDQYIRSKDEQASRMFQVHDMEVEKRNALKALQMETDRKKNLVFFSILISTLAVIALFLAVWQYRLQNSYRLALHNIEQLEKSRQKLFSIIAHDLRSPMNTYLDLAGTMKYLTERKRFDSLEKISQQIDDTGRTLKLMLNNLLNWSLSEQGNLRFCPEYFALSSLMNEILPVYRVMASGRNIVLKEDWDEHVFMYADRNTVSLVIRNLLDNALKNTASRQEVSLHIQKENDNYHIAVSNPYGPEHEIKLRQILPLVQNGYKLEPKSHGVGFGLVMLQQCTQNLKGRMAIQMDYNKVSVKISF